jgi:hypothetical protein
MKLKLVAFLSALSLLGLTACDKPKNGEQKAEVQSEAATVNSDAVESVSGAVSATAEKAKAAAESTAEKAKAAAEETAEKAKAAADAASEKAESIQDDAE